jgi:hypothetical protein
MADQHRKAVHQERRDGHPGQHHPPAVPQGIRHRHQLRFIAELSDEADSEADE